MPTPEHKAIEDLVRQQREWRDQCWNLIASENTPSSEVTALLLSDFSHRYGDYEGIDVSARKYLGNRYVVELEAQCQDSALRLFNAAHVDLRPLSGHLAGIAPLLALAKPGDAVLELSAECGGHRLAGKTANCPLIQLRALPIPFDEDQFNIDVQRTLEAVERERPRFVILGSSTFLFAHPVADLRRGIDSLNTQSILQYDASHVLGLIAGQRFQKPLEEGADLVSSSTHKTLGGPQGGLVLTNSTAIAESVGRALQPGLLSNHHLHRLPALCQTFNEWAAKGGDEADRIVAASRALAAALEKRGVPMVASHLGYTSSHTILVHSKSLGPAKMLAFELERADIIAGACRLPGRLGPDGLRLGTQEMVRRGMSCDDMQEVAAVMSAVLKREIALEDAKARVHALARKAAEATRFDAPKVRT